MENLEPKTRFEYFLNKIAENNGSSGDDSGGGGILVVGVDRSGDGIDSILTLTKTYREIKNATFAIIVGEGLDVETDVSDIFSRSTEVVRSLIEEDGLYIVNEKYETDNIDGYPSADGK